MRNAANGRRRASRRFTLLLCLCAVAILAFALVFNRHGLLAIAGLEREFESTRDSVDSLRADVDSLRLQTVMLQTDSAFIEKAVREILGWGRPGEFIIRIPREGTR